MKRLPLLPPGTSATCALAALLLSGCAADYANYPSLSMRPAERVSGTGAPATPTPAPAPLPPPPSSPELVARLDQLLEQAQAAHRSFMDHRPRAAQLVASARRAPVGSENWAQASVALAELETARSQAMVALSDLDTLYAAERISGGNAPVIAAPRDRVIALVREEDQVLAELRGLLTS